MNSIVTPERIALHLIKEDLKYHQLVGHLVQVELHLEFYPDLAGAVQQLLQPGLDDQELERWTNKYTREMRQAQDITWNDHERIDTVAEIILEILKP